jgi:hypothetical protein
VDAEVEAEALVVGAQGEGGDDREPIVPVPGLLDGRLCPGSPGPPHHRLQQEARFIQENDAPARCAGFFLCRASPPGASGRWPPRPARASEHSSPVSAGGTRRGPGGSARRRSSRSPGPPRGRPCPPARASPPADAELPALGHFLSVSYIRYRHNSLRPFRKTIVNTVNGMR